jgi:hypothetical protein
MSPRRHVRNATRHVHRDPIGYNIAMVGGGQKHHAITAFGSLCGLGRYYRALSLAGTAVTCQPCLVRLARTPDRYYHIKSAS